MEELITWGMWAWDHRDEAWRALMTLATALGAFVLAANSFVSALRGIVAGADAIARKTASEQDDIVLARVTRILDGAADFLSAVEARIPRAQVRMGSRPAPAAERRRSSRPPQG